MKKEMDKLYTDTSSPKTVGIDVVFSGESIPETVSQAFEILDEEAEAGKIDKDLLGFAKELYLNKKI